MNVCARQEVPARGGDGQPQFTSPVARRRGLSFSFSPSESRSSHPAFARLSLRGSALVRRSSASTAAFWAPSFAVPFLLGVFFLVAMLIGGSSLMPGVRPVERSGRIAGSMSEQRN
jgi:hypothetical protein